MLRKILIGLLIVFVVIQFIRPERNKSTDNTKDIATVYAIPSDVQTILKTSCYDCHSNNTTYVWYDEIQPVRWWIENHIKEGKTELNFSEFATYPLKKQLHKIEEIGDVVDAGEMPLSSYTIAHTDAKLSEEQKQTLVDWSLSVLEGHKQ